MNRPAMITRQDLQSHARLEMPLDKQAAANLVSEIAYALFTVTGAHAPKDNLCSSYLIKQTGKLQN